MSHESKSLIVCLWLALVACVAMLAVSQLRAAAEEDECAIGTLAVERTPFGLVCIGEPVQ
jgi:hypothetical protein